MCDSNMSFGYRLSSLDVHEPIHVYNKMVVGTRAISEM